MGGTASRRAAQGEIVHVTPTHLVVLVKGHAVDGVQEPARLMSVAIAELEVDWLSDAGFRVDGPKEEESVLDPNGELRRKEADPGRWVRFQCRMAAGGEAHTEETELHRAYSEDARSYGLRSAKPDAFVKALSVAGHDGWIGPFGVRFYPIKLK